MNQQEYQQLMSEIEYYQGLLEKVEASLNNLRSTKKNLEDFDVEKSTSVLAPIASGVYVEAELKSKDLFVNIGSGVVSKKTIKEAIGIINNQEKEVLLDQQKIIDKLEACYVLLQKKGD
jgi:prefoldin alpha subunit